MVLFKTYCCRLLQAKDFWFYKRGNKTISYSVEAYRQPVPIAMKREMDLVDKEHESEDQGNESSKDQSEDEEPRIKDFWVIFPKRFW